MECIFSNVFRGGDFLRILTVLSDLMVPLLIFYVVGLGLLMKQDVFGDFLNGAKAVSYTHLDVYKRQCADRSENDVPLSAVYFPGAD